MLFEVIIPIKVSDGSCCCGCAVARSLYLYDGSCIISRREIYE